MLSFTAFVIAASLQGAPAGYDAEMAAGRHAFDRFDVKDANAAFERAAHHAGSAADKARALAWLGAVRAENADFVGARVRFREALLHDRNVTLPTTLSPAIRLLLQEERTASAALSAPGASATTWTDTAVAARAPWVLWTGGAVAALGLVTVGGGAAMGLSAVEQRDASAAERFQSDAATGYQQARQNALWANVLYGAGGVLVAAGGGLAVASLLGADE